ncbi:DUF6538 domain-containing protein [Salinarimonas ramus]|uniref:Tyr recombinase domain-containing protein n=1 Tax=Salinarimonas ramus TaxID=690164 RepID=A0A917QBL5_9HYPH|nr:DUF6538 domain-containing protein [Salinarimonas ramus]GGK38851.1 hypothetical protein GCM10011322_27400 [Salinarimonas ramus]
MGLTVNLERRGAVYYWRRRLPQAFARAHGRIQLRLSLRTKEPGAARYLAAQLDAEAQIVFREADPAVVSGEQLAGLFARALEAHRHKLETLCALERQDGTLSERVREEERAIGIAFRAMARFGPHAALTPERSAVLAAEGHEAAAIQAGAAALAALQATGLAGASKARLADLLGAVGAEPTPGNVARAEPVYLRAVAEALLAGSARHDRDPSGLAVFGDTPCRAEGGRVAPSPTDSAPCTPSSSVPGSCALIPVAPTTSAPTSSAPTIRVPTACAPMPAAAPHVAPTAVLAPATADAAALSPTSSSAPDAAPSTCALAGTPPPAVAGRGSTSEYRPEPGAASSAAARPAFVRADASSNEIVALGERLVARNVQDGRWNPKTERQARMIFGLFARFLAETEGIVSMTALRQKHLDHFDAFLREVHRDFGKSRRDAARSIAEIRRISRAKPIEKRGLEPGTRNRHLTFLGQLVVAARRSGCAPAPEVDTSAFRVAQTKRGREQRVKPKLEQAQAFFRSPVFVGCRDWRAPDVPGERIFHRAAYFGPMLAHYQGLRREEYCGLAVADIVTEAGAPPHVLVRPNGFRGLKNVQSERTLALHPELMRLGLLEYAAALAALGHERLFPDLYSPSSKSPLGDRLYDELTPAIRRAGLTPHQVRHLFGNVLKQRGVAAEIRADLLGHGGTDETTERYCDAAELKLQLVTLAKLPIVTAHLERVPITLIPWVERREVAPWSRASSQPVRPARRPKAGDR